MKAPLVTLLALASFAVAAQDFAPAKIVDFQSRTKIDTPALNRVLGGPSIEADDYKEITVELNGQLITARTYAMGGGMIFVNNNATAFAVGREVEARVKRNELQVKVPERKGALKFAIQRVEIIKASEPAAPRP